MVRDSQKVENSWLNKLHNNTLRAVMLPNCPFYICKLVTGSNNLQHAAPNTTFLTAKQAAGKLTKKNPYIYSSTQKYLDRRILNVAVEMTSLRISSTVLFGLSVMYSKGSGFQFRIWIVPVRHQTVDKFKSGFCDNSYLQTIHSFRPFL